MWKEQLVISPCYYDNTVNWNVASKSLLHGRRRGDLLLLKDMMTPVHRTLFENSTLKEAIQLMKSEKWNVIPVTYQSGKLRGVFTRSCLFDMLLEGKSMNEEINEYIIEHPIALSYLTPYEQVEIAVKHSKVGTGVVLDEQDRPIGLFTKTDMITALFKEMSSLKLKLEKVLETTQLGAAFLNEHNVITFANDKLATIFNVEKNSLLGYTLPNTFRQSLTNKWKQIDSPNGKVLILKENVFLSKTKKATIIIVQEISEAEKVVNELETVKQYHAILETSLEHAYDGIVMIDPKGIVQWVSRQMCELFSLEEESVIGRKWKETLPHLHLEKVFETREPELSDILEFQGIRYIVSRLPVIQDGKFIGVIGKVTFRQLLEVRQLFQRLEAAENKMKFYEKQLRVAEKSRYSWEDIVSQDPKIERIKRSASKAAKGLSTVLIRGESGTGKELFTHAIHGSSGRKDHPLVTVNCAAIPEHLLESEFFGYEEGAFTGAHRNGKLGKFDLANGGTLFLDEIGDMSLPLQAKMLRVLQDKEFYRVGGTTRIQADVRIIAATNKPLEQMVYNGTFREDLFYRLNVISFQIPPLRARKNDIPLLCSKLIEQLNRLLGTSIVGIEDEAMERLLSYDWPGNVRELRNVLERGMIFAEHGKIYSHDLPDYVVESSNLKDTIKNERHPYDSQSLKEQEKITIIEALQRTNGNKSATAKLLGISRSSLYDKLKRFHLT